MCLILSNKRFRELWNVLENVVQIFTKILRIGSWYEPKILWPVFDNKGTFLFFAYQQLYVTENAKDCFIY